jgi:uncharacterized protein YegL
MDMVTSSLNVSPYGFSAASIDELGATEYTLVSIAQDVSGSVAPYEKEMETCLKEIVAACAKSPRADNLMLRLQTFGSTLEEVHGFKPLGECNSGDYDDCLNIAGLTALYDASENAIEALGVYGKDLVDNDYDVNAILIVVTDGGENDSTNTLSQVKKALAKVQKSEVLESIVTILVGVNVDSGIDQELEDFKNEVGFTQYVGLGDADSKTLAKLAKFVSSSISSQSSALGTGGPSQSLTF